MRRTIVGLALLLHGLAHANAAMLAANDRSVIATVPWAIASMSFLAAGFGLLGVRCLYRNWRVFGMAGAGSSILMLAIYRPATAAMGIVLDLMMIGAMSFVAIPPRGWTRPRTDWWAALGRTVVFAVIAYVGVLIVARPWHSRWGSSDAELRAMLPGDNLVPVANYTIQHAVTIQAAPEAVWPWLVQDLGGIFGPNLGWRVVQLEPQRAIVLGGWGAIVLEPRGDSTRLIVRTRGTGKPSVPLAAVGLLILEPAHFIMERRLLLGIKERAERLSPLQHGETGWRESTSIPETSPPRVLPPI